LDRDHTKEQRENIEDQNKKINKFPITEAAAEGRRRKN